MKLKTFVVAITMTVLSSVVVDAQKVVTDGGKVIIDCSAMPSGSVTYVKKAKTTTGTNNTAAGTGLDDIASQASNDKVYYRFEVSKTDNNTSITGHDWKSAVDICAALTNNGGWRLPTQRELHLMSVFRFVLEKQPGFVRFYDWSFYWSATQYEKKATESWHVVFRQGNISTYTKTSLFYTRCVRDI